MKVCFVGAGSIGKRHIRNFSMITSKLGIQLEIHLLRYSSKKLDDDIEVCVSRIAHKAEELDETYDAIFITNPTYKHYEVLISLLPYSDSFFIEKPVFNDIYLDLSVFNNAIGKVFYVACPLRYTQVLLQAQKILGNENVRSVRAISSSYLPDWRPGTDYRDTYSAHKEQGGGVRIDLIHEWDYLSALFGFPSQVKQLYGTYSKLELDSDDLAIYLAEYSDKLIELHLDYMGRITRRNCEVLTDDALYVFDITNNYITRNGKIIDSFVEDSNDKYVRELEFFIRLMKRELDNTNDINHAIRVMKIAYGVE